MKSVPAGTGNDEALEERRHNRGVKYCRPLLSEGREGRR